ncbi:hypothetical protein N0V87_000162 [Didymella glomerata]|uniref:F-box domain-containing protein n=1 Tax=Didymella glomerata TaxID=749621 RepID=A0A9W8X8E5_9PLEO|nr:hypothetical protein N0V87_000162 [Didymella glomerata]
MATLRSLPTELKIMIIEHLVYTARTTGNQYENYGADPLPTATNASANFSCVDRSFRRLVVPYLFRTLVLRNTVRSGDCVAHIATSNYAKYVKRLGFVATTTRVLGVDWLERSVIDAPPAGVNLVQNVEHVLSHLDHFPALEAMQIEFYLKDQTRNGTSEFTSWAWFDWGEVFEGWPLLISKVYNFVIRSVPHTLKALTLHNLPPCEIPTWEKPAWHKLLNGLTSFTLRFSPADSAISWDMARAPYHKILPCIKSDILNHLSNITRLTLAASQIAFLGADFVSRPKEAVHLSLPTFPKLETLEFDRVFMGNAVLEILLNHAKTLRSVRMQHVFVARTNFDDDDDDQLEPQMTWATAFTTLSTSAIPFSRLIEFELLSMADGANGHIEHDLLWGTRQREDPELRYTITDFEEGGVRTFDVEVQRGIIYDAYPPYAVLREAEDGVQADLDRVAYEEFMRIVWGNRQRCGLA